MKQLCVVLNQNILTLSSVLILLNCPHYWTLFVFLYPRLVHFVHRPHQSIWKRRWRWLYVRHLQTPLFSFFHRRKKTNFQDTLLLELFPRASCSWAFTGFLVWMMDKDDKDASKSVPFRTRTLWCGWELWKPWTTKVCPKFLSYYDQSTGGISSHERELGTDKVSLNRIPETFPLFTVFWVHIGTIQGKQKT